MAFYTEDKPELGAVVDIAPGIQRIVADNPSLMTYHGTNTYLIEGDDGIYVLDPGPSEDQRHLGLLIGELQGKAAGIILTHHHFDHLGLTPQLKAELDVPVYGFANFADDTFFPDIGLQDGDRVAGLEVLHTPGHASDHLCYARDDGVLFTGDHVMTWNSSIVSPPDGDMADYCAQLERLLQRGDKLYLPGHGPALSDPLPHTRQLLAHRERRESAIVEALRDRHMDAEALSKKLYRKTDPWLAIAALRNVEAHLEKLQREGLVEPDGAGVWALKEERKSDR